MKLPVPDTIAIDKEVSLQLINASHAEGLLTITNDNREHLRTFLPWVDHMQTVTDFLTYIDRCHTQHLAGTDYGYTILSAEKPVGRIGIHYINTFNSSAAIGYWISQSFMGKGIITKACRALLKVCFEALDLNRVEIRCATDNIKSAAVAERLHFTREGVLKQAEYVNGKYLDLALYAMVKSEWEKQFKDCSRL